MNRLKERSLNRPLPTQSGLYAMRRHSKMGTHINEASSNSFDGDDSIAAPITAGFFSRSPSAITWLIIAVIVRKSVQFHSGRAFSHIIQKWNEFTPRFEIRNTSPSIILELFSFRIIASLLHRIPSAICTGLKSSTVMSMFGFTHNDSHSLCLAAGRQLTLAACCNPATTLI